MNAVITTTAPAKNLEQECAQAVDETVLRELTSLELACVGGGAANVAFV
jgi:hypothetical protein